MYSTSKAHAMMQRQGLPMGDLIKLPSKPNDAVKAIRLVLPAYGVGKLGFDREINEHSPVLFTPMDSDEHIRSILLNGSHGDRILASIDPATSQSKIGIVRIETWGAMYVDIARSIDDGVCGQAAMMQHIERYHDLSRGTLTPSHTFVREPGRFWHLVKNSREDTNTYEVDLDIGRSAIAHMHERNYITPLLELANSFGSYAVSFFYWVGKRMTFFHPIVLVDE